MKIGIDLFPLVPGRGRGGGFYRFSTALIDALATNDDGIEYILFVNSENKGRFPQSQRMRQFLVPLSPRRQLWPFRLLWLHVLLPLLARVLRLDGLYFPFDTAPVFITTPYAVTINDVISDVFYPREFPGVVGRLKAWYLRSLKSRAARRAQIVISPSHATANELVRHYGLTRGCIRVIPYGVHLKSFSTTSRSSVAGPPYIFTVASLSPHKNLHGCIDAFTVARSKGSLTHEFWIAGMDGTGTDLVRSLLSAASQEGVPIRVLGYVSEEELTELYQNASLFVFLSLAEGFGLPVLEAMAAGVPVVASDAGSLPEAAGDAAWLVSPHDPHAAADAIVSILTDPAIRSELVERGLARAARATWDATGAETSAAFSTAFR